MTKLHIVTKPCTCGQPMSTELYQSVNLDLDPHLADKLGQRLINSYICQACGKKHELVHRLLYVDKKKNLWVWAYPEAEKKHKKKITADVAAAAKKMNAIDKKLKRPSIPKPLVVFGYDELLKTIADAK